MAFGKKLKFGLMGLAMLGGGLAGGVATTTSASAVGPCPESQAICLYRNVNAGAGAGLTYRDPRQVPNVKWIWDPSFNDSISSIVNNTNEPYCFYEHEWYGGQTFRVGPREYWPSIGYINDKITSWKPGNC